MILNFFFSRLPLNTKRKIKDDGEILKNILLLLFNKKNRKKKYKNEKPFITELAGGRKNLHYTDNSCFILQRKKKKQYFISLPLLIPVRIPCKV